jgi:hypothetical protein
MPVSLVRRTHETKTVLFLRINTCSIIQIDSRKIHLALLHWQRLLFCMHHAPLTPPLWHLKLLAHIEHVLHLHLPLPCRFAAPLRSAHILGASLALWRATVPPDPTSQAIDHAILENDVVVHLVRMSLHSDDVLSRGLHIRTSLILSEVTPQRAIIQAHTASKKYRPTPGSSKHAIVEEATINIKPLREMHMTTPQCAAPQLRIVQEAALEASVVGGGHGNVRPEPGPSLERPPREAGGFAEECLPVPYGHHVVAALAFLYVVAVVVGVVDADRHIVVDVTAHVQGIWLASWTRCFARR